MRLSAALIALLCFAVPAAAQPDAPLVVPCMALPAPGSTDECVVLPLPLLDAPYNVADGLTAPSMAQSLAVAALFYEGIHRLILDGWGERRGLGRLSVALFDLVDALVLPMPGASVWLHEEYHRAVMGRRGIGSFNDVYRFRVAPDTVAVSRVADEGLVRLKRDYPAEQVRLSMAGLEAEHHLIETLQKNQFFGRSRAWGYPLYWLEKLAGLGYLASGTDADIDSDIDQWNRDEGADIRRRDFTGHDFTAWVYDLHRPDEPYEARGIHPSGVGIDRYIRHADLTNAELSYLRKQVRLHALNFIDPFLIGRTRFSIQAGGSPMEMNLRLGHMLTPFGRTVETHAFLKRGDANLFVTVHAYANGERSFPGVDAELVDFPARWFGRRVLVTPRVALWSQPERLRFDARSGAAGGLAGLRVQPVPSRRLGMFVQIEGKTAGWVKGHEYLGRNVALRVGLNLMLE